MISGITPAAPRQPNIEWEKPREEYEQCPLYQKWADGVLRADNDFIMVVTAASKSRVSGVGKTTAAIDFARAFDVSDDGFSAENQSTLDISEFSRGILANPERVADRSAAILDEAQGTLAGTGVDARRSMAADVMEIPTALATLRYRQLTAIIVTQNAGWIDKRVDNVIDALVIIQPRRSHEEVRAKVFETYYNDLEKNSSRFTELLCTLTWDPIPKDDPDYQHLHELKEASAEDEIKADEEEADEMSLKERQKQFAQELRDRGLTLREIANSDVIDYGKDWVSRHTEKPEDRATSQDNNSKEGSK